MSYIVEGDNGTVIEVTVNDDVGPVDLTTADSITAKFKRENRTEFEKVLTVVNAAAGKCSAVLSSDDVSIPGRYTMQVTVNFSDGDIFSSDQHRFIVSSKL